MADITSPQAIRFCTENVRPLADLLVKYYYEARRVRDRYTSIGGAALIPNDASPILDGALENGLPLLTGANVNTALATMASVLTMLEANNSAGLQQLLAVAPGNNGQVRG